MLKKNYEKEYKKPLQLTKKSLYNFLQIHKNLLEIDNKFIKNSKKSTKTGKFEKLARKWTKNYEN